MKYIIRILLFIVIGFVSFDTCIRGQCDTRDYDIQTLGQTDGGDTSWDFRMV